jgi:hypothetical protein
LYHAEAQEQLLLKMAEKLGIETSDLQQVISDLAAPSPEPAAAG